ncbi:MAG: tetratricopeptide repeat protein [Gammaproteobacteria bacterium]|nr:tetratricopeptide repeat protein [Gammaproteobacteria bacterium]
MQYQDNLALDYTASSETSINQFNNVLDKYLASRADTPQCLDELLASDNDIAMAHCFRGYILKMGGDPRFTSPIKSCIESLQELEGAMNEREKMHLGALESWTNNQYIDATNLFEAIVAKYPKDMLALRIAHYLHFYAGNSQEMCDSIARVASSWQGSDPHYGYLLGMYSFGQEESGNYGEAETAGKQAVDINRQDIWAAHAITHVFYMQGRTSEGIAWIEGLLRDWEGSNNFLYHLYWHKALFHIGANELDQALCLYDDHMVNVLSDDFYLDVCNAATLLWRLQMRGVDIGDRWQALKTFSEKRVQDDELVFITLHYLMTPALLKDQSTIDTAMDHFESWSREQTTQGEVCRKVGLPLAQAIVEIGKGEFATATTRLSNIQKDIYLIGGSHAQRHLFDDLLNHYQTLI